MPDFPKRRAVCAECGKHLMAYVPTGWCESVDGPRRYLFRYHTGVFGRQPCSMWASRVPDNAFTDGEPNIDTQEKEKADGNS